MKKVIILFLFLFTCGFIACNKENTDNQATLDASKISNIKKGEPVQFTMNNAGSNVTWSVSPSASTQISSNGNKASVVFGKAGMYTVKAVSGNLTASRSVSVNDSVYNLNETAVVYSTVALTGDQIKLVASRIDSGSISGLVFTATTTNSYNCLNSILLSDVTTAGTDYTIAFSGVKVPDAGNCTTGQAKASSFSYIYPVSDGSHVLKITLNGVTYTGTIVKSGSAYTISWTYSSGVTISPLVL